MELNLNIEESQDDNIIITEEVQMESWNIRPIVNKELKIEQMFMSTVIKDEEEEEVQEPNPGTTIQGMTNVTLNEYQCGLCPKTFKTYVNLIVHAARHQRLRYHCRHCSKDFSTEKEQKDHLKTHVKRKKYKCKFCGKIFQTNYAFNNHIYLYNHMDDDQSHEEKHYKCDKCSYSSAFPQSFFKHKKVHIKMEAKLKSRSNWIKCEKCPFISFADNDAYQLHLQSVHR